MSAERNAYEVVVPLELAAEWEALPEGDHERLARRLRRAARAAYATPPSWPSGGTPGVHRGKHRALVDDLWVLYRLNDEAQTLSLMGFGRVEQRARAR